MFVQLRPPSGDLGRPASRPATVMRVAAMNSRWTVAAMIGTAVTAFYVVFRNGGWVFDDNFILVFARQHGFTLTWLETPLYQHWGAGTNAIFSVLLALFPIDYRWGLAAALIVLGVTIWMFERVFALVINNRRLVLGVTAWFAFSVLWIAPLQWWTFSVQVLPNVLFDLVCLYGFLRFRAGGGNRWIVLSAAAIAAGLLFYEKPAVMLLYLPLTRCLLMGERLRLRILAYVFWRERRLWLAYVAVVGVWGVAYLSTGARPGGGPVALVQYLTYFRIMWAQTLVPGVFGLSIPTSDLGAWQVIAIAAGQVAVIAAVAVSLIRSREAARAWMFLAVVVLITGTLVARSRIALFGVAIGSDPRYLMDFTWLVPLSVCAAFNHGSISSRTGDAPSRNVRRSRQSSRALTAICLTLLLLYAAVSVSTAARLERAWPALAARHWYQNVNHGLAEFSGTGRHPVIADGEVAPEIIGDWEDPYSRLSSVLPLYSPSVQVDGPVIGPLISVSADGVMRRATTTTVAGGSLSQLIKNHQAQLDGVVPQGPGCYRSSEGGGSLADRLAAPYGASASAPLYLVLDYRAYQPISVALFLNTGSGLSDVPDEFFKLTPQSRSSIAWLRFGDLHSFQLNFPPDFSFCLRRLEVVRVTTASSRS